MILFEKLIKLLEKAAPEYFCTYEEKGLMNITLDTLKREKPYAYIEEFRQGQYTKERFFAKKQTRVQIWFCRAANFQQSAKERENTRSRIEQEAVLPFIDCYEKEPAFGPVVRWEWATPPSRFDENEVSIMLQFTCDELKCYYSDDQEEN
jgi:hypothetical protein